MTNFGEMIGIEGECDFINFGERSKKGNPMGRYRNYSVFAADGYREVIKADRTYYCKLEKNNGSSQFYNAIPVYELTLEKIMEEDPSVLEQIASYIYELDRSKFDSEISAIQLREIKDEIEKKYTEKITRLEKDNERLTTELNSKESLGRTITVEKGTVPDHVDGNIFFSDKLEDRYYSVRINKRKDRLLLIKDENGEYGGHGNSIDISPFKKMLGTSDVKVEYCEKYSGVVIYKRV